MNILQQTFYLHLNAARDKPLYLLFAVSSWHIHSHDRLVAGTLCLEDVLNHALILSPEADKGNVPFDHSGAASTAGSCVTCHPGAPTVANNIIANPPFGVGTAYQSFLGDARVSDTFAAANLRQSLQIDAPDVEISGALLEAISKEAQALQNKIDREPSAYLQNAPDRVLNVLMRHLTRRMFLSPRMKKAVEARTH